MKTRSLYLQVHGRLPQRAPRRTRCFDRGPARNWKYRAWIRTLPSAVSGQEGCEAAHTGSDGGMRQKASDYSCIPLTPEEHREYHQIGKADFEAKYGIDCATLVKRLNRDWFQYGRLVK
jgi:Protein of unknown function (DUF968)